MPGGLSFDDSFLGFVFPKSNKQPRYYVEAHVVYNVNLEHMEKTPLRDQVLKFIQTCGKHPQSRGLIIALHISWYPH